MEKALAWMVLENVILYALAMACFLYFDNWWKLLGFCFLIMVNLWGGKKKPSHDDILGE